MTNTSTPINSYLDNVSTPTNYQEPTYKFLVDELFIKLEGANFKQNLGSFSNMTEKKIHIITQFITNFKLHIGHDFFPISKLIFPDKSGRLYFIKDITLARLIIKMYNIPKESEDYQVLFHWKHAFHTTKRFTTDVNNLRDLPLRISRIIANRRQLEFNSDDDKFSISDINDKLDLLNVAKKSHEQIEIMKPLLDKLSIPEVRWFLHILLKKSILTRFEHVLFESWHPQAWELFRICNNLQKTFNYLTDENIVLTPPQLNVQPMYKFRPQLSFKLLQDYSKLINDMSMNIPMDDKFQSLFDKLELKKGEFYMEEKMDGDRMVLHKQGKYFKFYSRRLKDYSFLYGENFEFGSLTKYLNQAFPSKIDSIILDGEMVAWDFKRNAILPFGTLKSSAIQESVRQYTTIDQYEQQSSYPFFLIFDVLHINGMNLTNHPLFFRKNILTQIINPVPHRFEVLPFKIGYTPEEIQNSIKQVISVRSEGIMIKHVQSKYFPGERNPHWIKIKPEYLEKFGENLDLTIIGRIPGIKDAFMCGLKNTSDQSFYSFCTVGNGFTNEEYDKIERITHGKWIKFSKTSQPPPNIIKFGSKKPIEWIHPRDSLVLEIKARSIDNTSEYTYAAGSTLHNLYCRSIRDDKSIHDCCTLEEYQKIKAYYGKDIEKSQFANKKRRKQLQQDSFNGVETKRIKVESDLFKSFQFIIVSDKLNPNGDRITRDELIILVKKYGGTILTSIDNPTYPRLPIIIITEKDLPSCQVYFEKGYDLTRPNWLFECINHQQIIPLEPMFIFKSKNLAKFMSKQDQFGDSFIIHKEIDLSSKLFGLLSDQELRMAKLDFKLDLTELGIEIPKCFLFNDIKCCVVGNGKGVEKLRNRIEKYGGEISEDYLQSSFIIAYQDEDDGSDDRIKSTINDISKSISENVKFDEGSKISKIPNIVTKKFIEVCIERNVIVDADDYKYI
ncbi:DNA ligase IV [Scheffersomyces coipomensis]|uniref:DNA ligase IV n=1 Tax=Scheffersomyces coipomensis TaxID=1788519 RepID=UPI00315D0EF8